MYTTNFNKIEQKLNAFGISLQEYIEGGYSLVGKVTIPSVMFDYNNKYQTASDENTREIFLLTANAALSACDQNTYH
jgi:hypothetical protein